MTDGMLAAEGLVKRYGARTVVNGVSIRVRRGEIVGLLGPNGAGKTTTFYLIVGLVRPDDGEVSLDGQLLTDQPVHARARRGIGYLAQDPSVFRGLTVEENILMVLEANGTPPAERRRILDRLLEEFGLTHLRAQRGRVLSGGERRRVEIARVLAMRPSYVLLDEPFTGVDPLAVAEIQDVVRYLRTRGIGVVITDHNVRDTLAITDRATVINEGRVLLEGSREAILADPEVRRVFLGQRFEM
ncbi:MAG TPA: LPS export ABC transporter ATP-binding protein [bacterium]|nr:LPS export ABC transporter ATP-binding protein [bacterium]